MPCPVIDVIAPAHNGDDTLDESFVYSTTGNLISRTRLAHAADAEIEVSIRPRPVHRAVPPQTCEHLP